MLAANIPAPPGLLSPPLGLMEIIGEVSESPYACRISATPVLAMKAASVSERGKGVEEGKISVRESVRLPDIRDASSRNESCFCV